MTIAQQAVLISVSNAALLGALVGLVFRRRWRLAYFFVGYMLAIVCLSSLVILWPERFHTWSFYWIKESIYSVLKIGVAAELTVTVFQAFPAARRVARGALGVVLVVTLIAAWLAAPGPMPNRSSERQWADFVLALYPRITNGTAWLFGALFAVILYYRLPLHALHKAIAFGFMAYLLFLTFALDLIRRSDFGARDVVAYANAIGYALVAIYWAWAAWRRDPPLPVSAEVVSRLQPWREGASPDL
jgi:hypothetical protein